MLLEERKRVKKLMSVAYEVDKDFVKGNVYNSM